MKQVNFNTTKKETQIIHEIAKRAMKEKMIQKNTDLLSLSMDISAVHLNGTKLKLDDFLKADDGNFYHDIAGIMAHIDRSTGKLKNCFSPRFSY